ncbi:GH25 family lysozyme [Duganella sp. Dugasp56]|uniref:GH25 family lysozyme n=1 Tax=Duganella sp. Dugasp56 TaxID=3243046 RepID=UPI0039B0F94F
MIKHIAISLWLLYGSVEAATCPNGAEVDTLARCKYFEQYTKPTIEHDLRITERLGVKDAKSIRSIALIVGIDTYSNFPPERKNLAPAKADVDNLREFFKSDQKFDEVIVLRNQDATTENIEYFLGQYLPQLGLEMIKKTRLVFAYSGHGVDSSNARKAVFLLSNAKNPDDLANSYRMNDLRDRLSTLSINYFHVLALINACYGGHLFDNGQGNGGGSMNTTEQPGAYAMTASSDLHTSASLGRKGDGSIFFDNLIAGIKSGAADREYLRIMDADGKLQQQGGIVRLGALNSYLDTEYEILNRRNNIHLDKTWIGPIQDSHARGGFFFLSPISVKQGAQAIHVSPGPRSSVPGRPDLKIFSAKEDYPIRGIDVSVHEGQIDWKTVKKKNELRFAYMRSSSWAGEDMSFSKHWSEAKLAGLDRGAIHTFDYCLTPLQQEELVARIVPKDASSLPIALVLTEAPASFNKREHACYSKYSKAQLQASILDLTARLHKRYEKIPLIYGTRSFLNAILDERFNRYMIWLAVYRKSTAPTDADLGLRGNNPWTIWQHTASLTVKGIGDNVDSNVFFGGEREYQRFKLGTNNEGLEAAHW